MGTPESPRCPRLCRSLPAQTVHDARVTDYGPFARMLLSVIALREKRPWMPRRCSLGQPRYPENPLIREELARARKLANPVITGPAAKK